MTPDILTRLDDLVAEVMVQIPALLPSGAINKYKGAARQLIAEAEQNGRNAVVDKLLAGGIQKTVLEPTGYVNVLYTKEAWAELNAQGGKR